MNPVLNGAIDMLNRVVKSFRFGGFAHGAEHPVP